MCLITRSISLAALALAGNPHPNQSVDAGEHVIAKLCGSELLERGVHVAAGWVTPQNETLQTGAKNRVVMEQGRATGFQYIHVA